MNDIAKNHANFINQLIHEVVNTPEVKTISKNIEIKNVKFEKALNAFIERLVGITNCYSNEIASDCFVLLMTKTEFKEYNYFIPSVIAVVANKLQEIKTTDHLMDARNQGSIKTLNNVKDVSARNNLSDNANLIIFEAFIKNHRTLQQAFVRSFAIACKKIIDENLLGCDTMKKNSLLLIEFMSNEDNLEPLPFI